MAIAEVETQKVYIPSVLTQIKVRTNPVGRISKPTDKLVTLKNGIKLTESAAEMMYSSQSRSIKCFTSVSKFAEWIGEQGHTVRPCIFTHGEKKDRFVSTNIIIIDFDNGEKDSQGHKVRYTGDSYTPLHKFINSPFAKKYCSFVYESFSSTRDWNRFHAVFITDSPLKSLELMRKAYKKVSKESGTRYDHHVNNSMRMFYGGLRLHEINFGNLIPLSKLFTNDELTSYVSHSEVLSTNCNYETQNITSNHYLLNHHEYDKVRSNLNYPKSSKTESEFYHDVLQVNMSKLFSLPVDKTFKDILHSEHHPSCTVIRYTKGDNRYLYCLRGERYFNNIELMKELTNTNYHETMNILAYIINCTITDSFDNRVSNLVNHVKGLDKVSYPDTYHYFSRYKYEIKGIMKLFEGKCLPFFNQGEMNYLFYMATRGISNELYGTEKKQRQVSRILKLMEIAGMIKSVPVRKIPDFVMNNITTGKQFRSNVYVVCNIDPDELEHSCKQMRDYGVTIRSLSKITVANVFGDSKASQTYRQSKASGGSLSQNKIELRLLSKISKDVQQNGFSVESELSECLSGVLVNGHKMSKNRMNFKVQQFRGKLINCYGFTRVRLNNQLKKELGVSDLFSKKQCPMIYIRKED